MLLSLSAAAATPAAEEDARIAAYVDACAKSAAPGATVRAAPNAPESYFLSTIDGVPTIKLDADLRWSGATTEREMAAAKEVLAASIRAVQRFYARYGIRVQPTFHYQRGQEAAGKDHFVIYLSPYVKVMSPMNWGVNAGWSDQDRAMVHTHEFSHLLGLKDEYETLMAVRIGEPDNIMRKWNAENGRLYLRQIRDILAPLCPGA